MADSSAVISVRQAVMSFFVRSPLDTRHLEKMMAIAIECVGDLNIYVDQQIREAYVEISDVNIASLPSDFIDCVRPPSIIVNHRIHELSEDLSIPLNTPIDCGNPTNLQPINLVIGEGYESRHFPLYREYGGRGLYGSHPTRDIAFYRMDYEHRIIRLRGHIKSNILYLEYLSTGISLDGQTLIDRRLLPVVRNYLMWQSIENDKSYPANDKERKKEQYEQSLDLFWHNKQDYSLKTLLNAIRSNYGQTAKG